MSMSQIISFADWLKDVNRIIAGEYYGYDARNLSASTYRDWYDFGMPASVAARKSVYYDDVNDECNWDYDD